MNKKGAFFIFLVVASIWFPSAIASSQEAVDEVYLLVRENELLAFSAVADLWVTQKLRPKERVLDSKYDGHVVVVFTNFRILGFSALINKWNQERLMADEAMITIEAKDNVGVAVTNFRALGFGAKTGRWIVKRLAPK